MVTAYICVGVFFIAVAVLTVILALRAPKAEHMAKTFVGNLVVGIFVILFFTGFTLMFLIKDRDPWALICLSFNLLGVIPIVMYYNCRMWLTDSCIIRQNFWGRRREWYYKDIVQIEEKGIEVIFHFRNTQKWLVYARDPKIDDPMLETIRAKIPKEQLIDDLPVPPVRLFEHAVYGDARGYYIIWGILYLLTLPFLLMGIVGRSWVMTLIVLVIIAAWTVYIVLAVYSAKRAHASEKWATVAKHCFKNGALRP